MYSASTRSSNGELGMKRFQYANDIGDGDVIHDDVPVYTGTAQAESTATTIKLDARASAVNDDYAGMWVLVTNGTGTNEVRRIKSYNGTTKIATIYSSADQSSASLPSSPVEGMDWSIIPDTTSKFALYDGQYVWTYYDEINDRYTFGTMALNPTDQPIRTCS